MVGCTNRDVSYKIKKAIRSLNIKQKSNRVPARFGLGSGVVAGERSHSHAPCLRAPQLQSHRSCPGQASCRPGEPRIEGELRVLDAPVARAPRHLRVEGELRLSHRASTASRKHDAYPTSSPSRLLVARSVASVRRCHAQPPPLLGGSSDANPAARELEAGELPTAGSRGGQEGTHPRGW